MINEVNFEKSKNSKTNLFSLKSSLIISLSYFIIGIVWIIGDGVITLLYDNLETMFKIHTYKSLLFFVLASVFIFILTYKNIKKIEDKLETNAYESEYTYRNLFHNNTAMMILIDPDTGKIIDVNESVCSFYGYSKKEFLSANISEISTTSNGLIYKHLDECKNEQSNYFLSIDKLANGELREVEVYNSYVRLNGQNMVLGIVHDITERKKAEIEHTKSEKKYRDLIEFLPDAVIAWNEKSEIVSANLSAIKLFEYSFEEEIVGKTLYDIIYCDYHEIVRKRITTLKTKKLKALPMIDMKGVKKNGTVVDIEVQSTYLEYNDEMMLITVARDITERKQREHHIKKLSQAVKQSFSMVIITDKEGNIEYVNPNFTEISGFKLEDMIGKNPDILDAKKQPRELRENMWQAINTGHRWRGELLNRAKNGMYYWVDASIAPVKDENNQVVNYVAVQNDITAKKRMIHELELKNSQLSCMVKHLKETQAQLIQQERLAGIGQLAAGVAHEINNPLGYVSSNFYVLRKYFNSYKQILSQYKKIEENVEKLSNENLRLIIDKTRELERERNLDFINQDLELLFEETKYGLDRIKEIVMGLRVFSRVDQAGDLEDYDLNQGIKTTLIIANNVIKYHAEVITCLEEIPVILAKGGEINQVLLNLIVNAAHATKTRNSNENNIIRIITFKDEKYVYCEVEDNGIGIPKENLDKVFSPFFTTKPVGEGTGLGLHIAYNIIHNKHNGDIWVESEEGVGTKFIFKLPLSQPI